MSETTIYAARRIVTLDRARPRASHVAVRDGRIVAVGSLEECRAVGRHVLDERFADLVLLPGFVEGHTHLDAGSIWSHCYCGYYDRIGPDGRRWSALRSLAGILDRLREFARGLARDNVVIGWGFDPIFLGIAFTRHELDRVSAERPVVVIHASGHVLYANTVALQRAGLLPARFTHDGLPLAADGLPTGELRGVDVALPAAHALGIVDAMVCRSVEAARTFGRLCVRAGVTTATDLANPLDDTGLEVLQTATNDDAYPARIVAALMVPGQPPREAVTRASRLRSSSTERLRLGAVKLVLDGSIQAFTARLLPPGYYNGAANGLWYMAPEHVREALDLAFADALPVHIHTNGDQATELALDCLEQASARHGGMKSRCTLQHAQLTSERQFVRMAKLGVCANLFVNHVYFWGEQHAAITVGPERAARMNGCRTALECGVALAVHSDEPVTPMAPLFTAGCAVNRLTSTGQVLGPEQRIGVDEALRAITVGGAYSLGLEHEIGTIAVGKRADFAVLHEDPSSIDPAGLKDIRVFGTVLGGTLFPAVAA